MKYFVILLLPLIVAGWGQKYEKIRLRDVQVLTLKAGEMTTGRRSSPVPQLSCVGGNGAGQGWEPNVVQCYNRGWDGRDVQWECKADMEGTVRFGRVEVICEGYDYADDDFILAGSCGLEYTLELTKEGKQQNSYSNSQGGGGWFGSKSNQYNSYNSYDTSKTTSGLSDLIIIIVFCILIYAFYKTCIDGHTLDDRQYSATDNDYPGNNPGKKSKKVKDSKFQVEARENKKGKKKKIITKTTKNNNQDRQRDSAHIDNNKNKEFHSKGEKCCDSIRKEFTQVHITIKEVSSNGNSQASNGVSGSVKNDSSNSNADGKSQAVKDFNHGSGGSGTSSSSGTRTASGFGGTRRRTSSSSGSRTASLSSSPVSRTASGFGGTRRR